MRDASDWLVNLTPRRRGRVSLLCLPFAGGGAGAFHDWPDGLPPDVEVWAVRLPGRESRLVEEPYRDLGALVDALVPEVAGLVGTPYAVFGHSMGALVGYELVRRLRAAGLPEPGLLVASGHDAPHVAAHPRQLHAMPDPALVAALRDYGATPDTLLAQPELLELFLPTIRADFAVVETYAYRPGPPLRCPFAVLRGVADHDVTPAGCAAWAELTAGPTAQLAFPGGHFFIDEARERVLAELTELLDGVGRARRAA
ncbi:alpha/beta fold hydrolase [Actinokineospora auranticolor]|uniref:Surfactin synthase thioesterase subunit n=1 Tax=Actinokineospora auranticolor TaxID=155976 RepID=A0A2S6GD31_9PSEU|nr:alpha/beta fold hydrolase [Actinokineospora auranticolor]PPK63145.1 surfactin synthase thioesterase subunit [Actinokineospora auranticolor]